MKITTILFFMNVFSGMGYSILSPLFPSLGTKEGLTEALIGCIITVFKGIKIVFLLCQIL